MAAVTGNSTLMTTGTGFDSQDSAALTTPGHPVTTPPTRHMAITSLCLLLLRTLKGRQLKCPQLFTLRVRLACSCLNRSEVPQNMTLLCSNLSVFAKVNTAILNTSNASDHVGIFTMMVCWSWCRFQLLCSCNWFFQYIKNLMIMFYFSQNGRTWC